MGPRQGDRLTEAGITADVLVWAEAMEGVGTDATRHNQSRE